jgi:O-antigen/teichoic acid export membrane protein
VHPSADRDPPTATPAAPLPSIFARAMRGSAFTAMGYAAGQALRLGSNLILTRLLFPEAFGLMTLVTVFVVGLMMVSDVGIGPSIAQNRRGDDPEFLNTAWTIQVLRGALLWLATCLLALPAAAFYGAPELAHLLPVAGLSLLIGGFNPTRIETANRHILLGRLTLLDLAAQAIGIIAMVALALAFRSVWALVIGGTIGALAKLVLTSAFLPGARNRFRWEKAAARDLIGFGKWIFLSTILGFVVQQGDKAILGRALSLEALGVYNIGFFLASFPMLLGGTIIGRVVIPLYRETAHSDDPAQRRRLRRMRAGLSAILTALVAAMALGGVPLVGLLYDDRYALAGSVVVGIAMVQMGQIAGATYDQAALAAGDARGYFLLFTVRVVLQTGGFIAGLIGGGLGLALAGQAAGVLVSHGFIVLLARRHNAWDPLHDAVALSAGLALAALAGWINSDALAALAQFGQAPLPGG